MNPTGQHNCHKFIRYDESKLHFYHISSVIKRPDIIILKLAQKPKEPGYVFYYFPTFISVTLFSMNKKVHGHEKYNKLKAKNFENGNNQGKGIPQCR